MVTLKKASLYLRNVFSHGLNLKIKISVNFLQLFNVWRTINVVAYSFCSSSFIFGVQSIENPFVLYLNPKLHLLIWKLFCLSYIFLVPFYGLITSFHVNAFNYLIVAKYSNLYTCVVAFHIFFSKLTVLNWIECFNFLY